MKKLLLYLICLSVLLSMPILQSSCKAASSNLKSSLTTAEINDVITVVVTFKFDIETYALSYDLYYSDNIEFVSTDEHYNRESDHIVAVSSLNGVTTYESTYCFKVISSGTATINLTDCIYASDDERYISGSCTTIQIKETVYGDINKDGTADIRDLLRLNKYLSDSTVEVNKNTIDFNNDGVINALDLIMLKKYLIS